MRALLPVLGLLLFAAAGRAARGDELPPPADKEVDFVADIQPLLAKRCYSCHGAEKHEGGLRLHKKGDAFNGGDRGPAFLPGDSAGSRMIQFVGGQNDEELLMPPADAGGPLPREEISLLRAWIDQGAKWPDDADLDLRSRHWSFQPIARPEPPAVKDAAWVKNSIDAFVLARLEAEGIVPSPEADRPTLVRRLSLDLIGLPPTPADVDQFLADASPGAYERLVDRLLASPHYGERWGRHWLDQARYGDSDGYEKDNVRPHAWRWRNWVIDALNRDLPFDQFTIEQLAGDLLPDATLEQRVATGFHRNTLTNTEGGVDQEEFRVAATVDRVNTTGAVWLGLTIGCAQCHSHKYDPITQKEYYQLFAFFNSEQETAIPAPLPGEVEAYEQAKAAHAEEQARLAAAVAAFERDELPQRQAAWEASVLTTGTVWTVLNAQSATSAGGTTLAKQPDGSLLASGANPAADTYTIVAATDLAKITALRLEVLPDPSLPAGGPGRVAHGNFVLSEIRLAAAPVADPAQSVPVALAVATADFSQGADMKEWPVAAAIDGDTNTGWAVAPEFNKRHVAVFELKDDLALAGGATLTITLDQQYGMQHTIGRPRLSVTTAPRPVPLDGLPDDVVAILRTPAAERSAEVGSPGTELEFAL